MPETTTERFQKAHELFGKKPDGEIAKTIGVSRTLVGQYRRKHGLPAYEGHKLTPGKKAPTNGKTTKPPAKAKPQKKKAAQPRASKLDPYMDLLGVIPDREVAEKAGVSVENVRSYRVRRGIEAKWRQNGAAKKVAAKAAPKKPTKVVSKKTAKAAPKKEPKAPAKAPTKKRPKAPAKKAAPESGSAIEKVRHLLGKKPDGEIAAMLKVDRTWVGQHRRKHGIPAYQGHRKAAAKVMAAAPAKKAKAPAKTAEPATKTKAPAKAPTAAKKTEAPAKAPTAAKAGPKRRRSKLDPYLDLLGVVPDAEIAKKAKVTLSNVQGYRSRHGIAAKPQAAAPAKAAPAASAKPVAEKKAKAPAPAMATPQPAPKKAAEDAYAVEVTTGGKAKEYFVLAEDISAAATKAQDSLKGTVTSVRHLGPALA